MIIVSGTSSPYYAAQIEAEGLFQQLFGEVIILFAVRDELLANGNASFIDRLFSHAWLKV